MKTIQNIKFDSLETKHSFAVSFIVFESFANEVSQVALRV